MQLLSESVQMLKQKVVWLEASNIDLHRQLEDSRIQLDKVTQNVVDSQVFYMRILGQWSRGLKGIEFQVS
jgi:hypothetical protein